MERNEFAEQAVLSMRKAAEYDAKARHDLFERGMRMAVDGAQAGAIDEALSQAIARETDENARLLMEMRKTAVLSIPERAPEITLHQMAAHLHDEDLEAAQGFFLPDVDFFEHLPAADSRTGDGAASGELAAQVAALIRKALAFASKARARGIMSLDGDLDPGMTRRRDVFEYGPYFAADGVDAQIMDGILSRIVERGADENARLLMGLKKAAALLIQSRESAAGVLGAIASGLSRDDLEAARELLPDLDGLVAAREPGCDGPVASRRFLSALWAALEKRTGGQKADELMGQLASGLGVEPFDFPRPRNLASVLAYLEPDNARFLLERLPDDARAEIARLMPEADPDGAEAAREVERFLGRKIYAAPDGEKDVYVIAGILNEIKPELRERILEAVRGGDPELAEGLASGAFGFDDMACLDGQTIQIVMRETDARELAVALKSADVDAQEKIFRNMSRRAALSLKEDMESMGLVRLSDCEEAQGRIFCFCARIWENMRGLRAKRAPSRAAFALPCDFPVAFQGFCQYDR